MIINGKYIPNKTCKHCRYRHPASMTCEESARQAKQSRASTRLEPSVPDDYIRYAKLCALWDEFKTEYDLCDPEIVARFRREKDWCL